MLPHTQDAPALLQSKVFQHSLDWRFLLPVTEPERVCLLLQENAEFDRTLAEVGLQPSQRLSLSQLQEQKDGFHSFVMPFGLPVEWVESAQDQAAFYARLRRLMSSDSYLLIGFANAWTIRPTSRTDYYASRPGQMIDYLKRAGFKHVKIFGVMPNLRIPEYIFDIESPAIRFALRNRFRRKPAILRALHLLAVTMGWRRIAEFLPCYFVLAVA